MDILDKLSFDEVRCELQFSKGVAQNIKAASDEIKRLRENLERAADYIKNLDGGDPRSPTGWKPEELLGVWMRARAALDGR